MSGNPAEPNRKSRYHQGVYKVQNPDKYLGDVSKCVYRSSWEKKVYKYLDRNPKVLGWSCEPFAIPYLSPKDNRVHRYFPDIIVVAENNGEQVTTLIEVKPLRETQMPKGQGKKKSQYLYEVMTYSVNKAKWKSAEALCKKKGWTFKIMTEKDIKP